MRFISSIVPYSPSISTVSPMRTGWAMKSWMPAITPASDFCAAKPMTTLAMPAEARSERPTLRTSWNWSATTATPTMVITTEASRWMSATCVRTPRLLYSSACPLDALSCNHDAATPSTLVTSQAAAMTSAVYAACEQMESSLVVRSSASTPARKSVAAKIIRSGRRKVRIRRSSAIERARRTVRAPIDTRMCAASRPTRYEQKAIAKSAIHCHSTLPKKVGRVSHSGNDVCQPFGPKVSFSSSAIESVVRETSQR